MADKEREEKKQKEVHEEMGYTEDNRTLEEMLNDFKLSPSEDSNQTKGELYEDFLNPQPGETNHQVNCNHFYSDFRTETANGKLSKVYFYCSRCLDIQIKNF